MATARKCRFCGEYLDEDLRGRNSAAPTHQINVHQVNAAPVYHHPVPRWSPGVAALLSFLLPGLGQLYKGEVLGGMLWFVVVIVGYFLLIVPGLILHLVCILAAASGDPTR